MHKKHLFIAFCSLIITLTSFSIVTTYVRSMVDESLDSSINSTPNNANSSTIDWHRPEVPPRVGLQVGHWKNDELPAELSDLIGNTGTSGGGTTEVQINYDIAKKVAVLLEKQGVQVDILPATVPPKYWADVFIAIHADGSKNKAASGFKIAAAWRDYTGRANQLVSYLEDEYQRATKLPKDLNITDNMKGYYAFSWWRFNHAIDPMTTPAIVETGFLTSPADQHYLVHNQDIPARGIAEGILAYLRSQGIVTKKL